MNRRDFLKAAAVGSTSIALSPWVSGTLLAADDKSTKKPNIILIMADDLGYECMGANGSTSYKTPVFDRLSCKGMRFEHCYAQPLCTPTRVKIMTGISNVRNYERFGLLPRDETTFAQLFKKAGYATCVVGKWQLGQQPDYPQHFGFDESCLWQHMRGSRDKDGHDTRYAGPTLEINGKPMKFPGRYGPDVVSDFACDFMEKHKNEPFLVYYPMILVHCPFCPTPDSQHWDSNSNGSLQYKGDPKYFGEMVTYMDKLIGKVVDKVRQLGLADNTLILFLSDNGTDGPVVSQMGNKAVPGEKGNHSDNGTRVPLVAYCPGLIPEGKVCSDIVDVSDFLPTICEAAGIEVPAKLKIDGHSFMPQLRGKKGMPREWIYMWYNEAGGMTAKFEFARNQKYKLFRSGQFLDMTDGYAPKVLDVNNLSDEQHQVHVMLLGALDRYKDTRPAKFARDQKKPVAQKKKKASSAMKKSKE
ncbi:MAG: sulfatase-like hydrolase/transferase [Planctomycetota bacterium]